MAIIDRSGFCTLPDDKTILESVDVYHNTEGLSEHIPSSREASRARHRHNRRGTEGGHLPSKKSHCQQEISQRSFLRTRLDVKIRDIGEVTLAEKQRAETWLRARVFKPSGADAGANADAVLAAAAARSRVRHFLIFRRSCVQMQSDIGTRIRRLLASCATGRRRKFTAVLISDFRDILILN